MYVSNFDALVIESEILIPIVDQTEGTINSQGTIYLEENLNHIIWQRVEDQSGYSPFATIISTKAPYEIINTIPILSNTVLYSPQGGNMVSNGIELQRDTKNKKYLISNLSEANSFYKLYSFNIENFNPTTASSLNFIGTDSTSVYNNLYKTFLDSDKELLYHIFQNSPQYAVHKYNSQTAVQQGITMSFIFGDTVNGIGYALAPPEWNILP